MAAWRWSDAAGAAGEGGPQPRARRLVFHAGDVVHPGAGRTVARAIEAVRPDVVHSHAVQGMSAAVLTRGARLGAQCIWCCWS